MIKKILTGLASTTYSLHSLCLDYNTLETSVYGLQTVRRPPVAGRCYNAIVRQRDGPRKFHGTSGTSLRTIMYGDKGTVCDGLTAMHRGPTHLLGHVRP